MFKAATQAGVKDVEKKAQGWYFLSFSFTVMIYL